MFRTFMNFSHREREDGVPASLETTLSPSPVTVSRILYLTLLLLWIIRILSMSVKKVGVKLMLVDVK